MSKIWSYLYIGIHVKYPLYLSYFNETWIFLTDFLKILKYQISWKSVPWELSCMWPDRWTDMMKLIVAFCSFANAPKNIPLKDSEPLTLHRALGQKTKGPQVPGNVSPHCSFICCFFYASLLVKKVTVEANAYAKEKIVNKSWCQFSVWHECYDGV